MFSFDKMENHYVRNAVIIDLFREAFSAFMNKYAKYRVRFPNDCFHLLFMRAISEIIKSVRKIFVFVY